MGILEGRERPWRRREDSFADVLNAVKPLLTRFCVAKSVTYPPNLPNPPRTSPQTPALYTVKRCFALYGGGCLWGSSFSFLGGIYALISAAFAPDLRAGYVGREYAFRKCRFILPHIENYLSTEPERHMGRSLQRFIIDGLRTLQGRNPKGAPRISSASPILN